MSSVVVFYGIFHGGFVQCMRLLIPAGLPRRFQGALCMSFAPPVACPVLLCVLRGTWHVIRQCFASRAGEHTTGCTALQLCCSMYCGCILRYKLLHQLHPHTRCTYPPGTGLLTCFDPAPLWLAGCRMWYSHRCPTDWQVLFFSFTSSLFFGLVSSACLRIGIISISIGSYCVYALHCPSREHIDTTSIRTGFCDWLSLGHGEPREVQKLTRPWHRTAWAYGHMVLRQPSYILTLCAAGSRDCC